jgi:dUTP pyrophosphatase
MLTSTARDVLSVVLLHPNAIPPARTRPGDAAYDLYAVEDFTIAPGERAVVGTGVGIAGPADLAGLVVPRSGLAAQHGVTVLNGPGLIDPSYRGELRVPLINLGADPFEGAAGHRIAQLLLVPFGSPAVEVTERLAPSTDDRGANGFGSSGR